MPGVCLAQRTVGRHEVPMPEGREVVPMPFKESTLGSQSLLARLQERP